MPFAGPTRYMGPSGDTGAFRTIVAPSRLGSKWIAPPAEWIWSAAQRMEPTTWSPLVLVTVTSTKSPVGAPDRALALVGSVGATDSSAQAPSATMPRRLSAAGHRPAREKSACIRLYPRLS